MIGAATTSYYPAMVMPITKPLPMSPGHPLTTPVRS